MKSTMQYSVGGEIFDVADDRLDEFLADAYENYEDEPEEIYTFWINGSPVKVKESRLEEFYEDARKNGVNPVGTQGFEMDDGQIIHLKDEDVRQFVQARRTGQAMSRGMLKQTGIPEQYGRSAADREALADAFGAYYQEEEVNPKYLENERNLGDAIMPPKVAVDAVKGFGEGLKRSVTDFDELMEETYGDNAVTRALQGANANAGRMVHGLGETASTALGGRDTALGRGVASAVQGIDTEAPELETSNRYMKSADRAQREAAGTAFKYTIPGAAAVDAMGAANTTFRDVYNTAVENGASTEKALALASARSGLRVADVLTDASAIKGFKNAGFLKNLIGNVALGAGFDYAGGIVDQMAEGKSAKDIDYKQPLDKEGSGVLEGAIQTGLMAAMGTAGRGIADAGKSIRDYDVKADRKAEEARVKKTDSEDAARAQYDRTMSDEAAWQLDREIQEQVDAGTISEGAKDRVKARVEGMFDSKRSLDNEELREAALMKAIGEEQTPTRVESAGLERRKVEQKMRENEYWAKRSDELAAQYGKEEAARKVAEEQAAVERKAAADEIAEGEREAKKNEIRSTFDREEGKVWRELYAERDKELSEYEKQESERKAREEEYERTLQPQELKINVSNGEESVNPLSESDNTNREWSEYKSWLKKSWRKNTPKNWNRFIMENELDPRLKVDTKDQKAWESKMLEHEGDVDKKEDKKPYDYGDKAGEVEERKWDEARYTRDRVRKQHPEMSDEDFNARWNSFDHGYKKAVAEWEAKKEAAKKQGKKFIDPMPDATQMEYDFNVENPVDTTPKVVERPVEKTGVNGKTNKVAEESKAQVEKPVEEPNNVETVDATDAGFKAWAVGRDGKPMAFATKADEKRAREMFEREVKRGNVDPVTGKRIDKPVAQEASKTTVEAPEAKDVQEDVSPVEKHVEAVQRVPDGKGKMVKKANVEVEGEASGADAVKAAAKLLGADAYNKAELEKKLGQWEANPTEANAKHREAAKLMLGKLEGAKKAEDVPVEVAEKPVEVKNTDKPVTEVPKEEDQNKSQETPEQFRDRVRGDAVLNRIDAAMKKAKTETERNALMEQFKARVNELRRLEIDDTTTGVKLQDHDFKAWAAKKGRVASDGARREYDAEQVDALGKHIAKNWMKGVTFRRSENAAEVPNHARQIYSKDGNVIGWYDGAKKEVVTLPGADAGTVAHELGWHATYDHAKERAAAGDRTLLDKLNKYANDAKRIVVDPTTGQTLEQVITARYGRNGVTDPMVLLDEVGAARFTGENVAKFKDAAARRQAAQWYERAWNAVADTYKSMLSKMGWNKARLDNLNALTPEQTVQLLADEMLKGRTLGKAEKRGIDMDKAETLGGKYVRKMKDYLEPLGTLDKDAGNSVSGGIKTKMRLLPGKVQAAINEAEAFSRELEGKMKKSGVTAAELNEYMYAKAAGERNAKILARNGRLEGSAMSHADIQRVLGAYDNSSKKTALEQLSREVLQFQQNGFDERVRAGLISRSEANRLMAEEPNHVPMKSRFDAEGNHTGFDASATFGKPEWKKAEGRTNIGDGPLEWILQEYVDAKSHAAQNNARQSLLATVLAHPEMGTVKKLRPGETSGEMRKTTDKGEPNVVTVKSNGDTYRITLNGSRGELIARAMTGRGISRTPKALQKASRVWASTATEWSPTFAARNFLADTIDVFAVNTAEHGIIGGAIKNAKHEWNAIKMAKDIRGYVKTGKTNNATLREAIDAGILMGGGVRSRAFADTEAGLQTLKKDFAQGKNRAKAIGKTLFGWVGTINQTAEMMNRVADYKLQRDAGKSKSEAALHAREVTVDFNQKGEYTPWTNMAYMFSNSALGSTMRLNKALFKSKNGMQLAAGTFAMGLAEGFAEASNNGDDEEGKNVNEYTRASSIYFRNGKDIYRIPMHASLLSLVKYAGNCAARKMMGTLGKDKALNQIADDAIGILTQFAGIGDIGDNWKSGIAPSIIQPVIQAAFNRDFADRPIEKAVFDENMPKSHNGRTNTPEIYKAIAKAINSSGGGNEARKGSIAGFNADVSPEMIKHFAEGFGKNALRDVSNVEAVIEMMLGKSEVDRRNIPVVRDYFRTSSENDDRFFKAYSKYKGDVTEFQKRTSWESGEKAAYMKDRPWLYKTGNGSRTIDRLVNGYTVDGRHVMGINDLRKMEQGFARKKGGGYIKHEWSKEKVEGFNKRRLEMQRKVIDKMDRR